MQGKVEGSKLNFRSQRSTHNTSIDPPHVLDSGEVQPSGRLKRDVGFQLAIFAIQSFELRVPLDANEPAKARSHELDPDLSST